MRDLRVLATDVENLGGDRGADLERNADRCAAMLERLADDLLFWVESQEGADRCAPLVEFLVRVIDYSNDRHLIQEAEALLRAHRERTGDGDA